MLLYKSGWAEIGTGATVVNNAQIDTCSNKNTQASFYIKYKNISFKIIVCPHTYAPCCL